MIKVYKIKDILKYLVAIVVVIILAAVLTRYFLSIDINTIEKEKIETNIQQKTTTFSEEILKYCITQTIPLMNHLEQVEEIKDEDFKNQYQVSSRSTTLIRFLDLELGMIHTLEEEEEEEDIYFEENQTNQDEENIASLENAKTDVNTQVIDQSGINTKYTNTYGSVQIKNESKYELIQEMLIPNLTLENTKDIILFHTHTCESYTPSEMYSYEQTGNFRTTDLNYTVSRVGKELETYLKNYGYHIIHNTDYHDYPAYSGSYNRSLTTVQNLLSLNSGTQMVFDIHRDAVGSNSEYAPIVKIEEEYAAQLMFVIGTNGGGLEHNNWNENLKFAIKIQEKANELYPGLFKPIILRNSRYNQHLAKAANIIEVGATGNTLEQCLTSMKYLSKVIDEILK